jgi:hypothetical protein
MPQFKAFCESAEKVKRLEQASLIAAVNVGSQGEGKDVKKAVDGLTRRGNS